MLCWCIQFWPPVLWPMRGLGSDHVTRLSEECTKGQNGVLQHKYCSVDALNFDPRCCENQQKINFFYAAILEHFQTKNSIMRPFLSSTFPQGFRISKNFGHPTLVSGGKIGLKIKVWKGDRQTDKQTHRHTHRQTIRLLDRINMSSSPTGCCALHRSGMYVYNGSNQPSGPIQWKTLKVSIMV